jgi:hypothetical protein
MLRFLGEGELASGHTDAIALAAQGSGRFTQWGWNVSDYTTFKAWSEIPDHILDRMAREADKD